MRNDYWMGLVGMKILERERVVRKRIYALGYDGYRVVGMRK